MFAIEVNEHRRKIAQADEGGLRRSIPSKDDVHAIVMDKTGGVGRGRRARNGRAPDAIRTGFNIVRRGGRMSLLGIPPSPFR